MYLLTYHFMSVPIDYTNSFLASKISEADSCGVHYLSNTLHHRRKKTTIIIKHDEK